MLGDRKPLTLQVSICLREDKPGAVLPGHHASRKLPHLLQISGFEIMKIVWKPRSMLLMMG